MMKVRTYIDKLSAWFVVLVLIALVALFVVMSRSSDSRSDPDEREPHCGEPCVYGESGTQTVSVREFRWLTPSFSR